MTDRQTSLRRRSGLQRLTTAAPLLVLGLAGCGGGSEIERVVLSGEVTYKGEVIRYGEVRFVPEQGTLAPLTIALIKQGKYDTSLVGGVPVGDHRVEVRGYHPDDYENIRPGPFAPPARQLLPDKYHEKSTLKLNLAPGSESPQDYPFRLEP
jgi:hypothetical protein